LAGLSDVTLSAPSNGQVLTYNGSVWVNSTGGGGAMTAHDLSGIYHTGTLNWALVNKAGSTLTDIATRPHSALTGIGPNDHHNQVHALVSSDHTASGLTTGNTLRATGPTTFAWAQLQHTDLGNILPDQHHAQVHNIVGTDHTLTAAQWQVVGATATNTLGLLTPSSNPGANAAILRTDVNGALVLDTNLLYVDAVNNRVGINRSTGMSPGAAALDMQVSALADHTQRIKQVSGQTGRMWRIEDIAGNELIVLDSVGNLQSGQPGFVSGLTGWQISYLGNAEFNNVWVRGELHATVFVKDEVHATGGTLLVATAGKLHSQANIDSTGADLEELEIQSSVPGASGPLTIVTTSGTFAGTTLYVQAIINYLDIDDPPSGPGFYFTQGDVIRSKTEVTTGVTDFWLEVNNARQYSGYSRYSVLKRSGTDGVLPAGSAVVSYGKPGAGRILLTSDLNYAPYLDVFNVGPNVWTGAAGAIVPRVRLGRLDGVGLPGISGVEQYGMVAGTDLSNANSPYFIASNLYFRLYKINITLNDGVSDTAQINQNGSLTLGSNIGVDAGKSFQVINGTGNPAQDGNVIIGNKGLNQYLEWNSQSGVLTVVGAIAVPGGGASTVYVDAGDAAAKAYSMKRNVTAVGGTWVVEGPTRVSWGSPNAATVTLGGAGYAITAGTYTPLDASHTTYLYVDVSTVSPFTLQQTTTPTALNVDQVVVAIFNPGLIMGSVTLMGGTTYISGSNIITGTIQAGHIVAHTITANEIASRTITANEITALTITANEIAAATITAGKLVAHTITANEIAATTITAAEIASNAITSVKILAGAVTANKITVDGNIAIGASGSISGGGKTYGVGAGFFLGQSGGVGNYQFDVGNATNFMRWDGAALLMNVNNVAVFNTSGGTNLLSLATTGLAVAFSVVTNPVTLAGAALEISNPVNVAGGSGYLRAEKLINAGSTMQIEDGRTDITTATPGFGLVGEIAWGLIAGINYLYLCVAAGQWKRVQMNTW
jgi:hypothetical protein